MARPEYIKRAPNTMTFCLDHYNDNEFAMMTDVSNVLKALTKNEYKCVFRYEDCGVYVLEFGYEDETLEDPSLEWIDLDELYKYIYENTDDECE